MHEPMTTTSSEEPEVEGEEVLIFSSPVEIRACAVTSDLYSNLFFSAMSSWLSL